MATGRHLLILLLPFVLLVGGCGDDPVVEDPPRPEPPVQQEPDPPAEDLPDGNEFEAELTESQDLPSSRPLQTGVELSPGLVTTTEEASCAPCHAEVVQAYRQSGMRTSMSLPQGEGSPESRMAGREREDEETGIVGLFGVADGHYTQRLVYRDPVGDVRSTFRARVDLVCGSGRTMRAYLHVREGRFFQLPLVWNRQTDDLALMPGAAARTAVLSRAPNLCLACHMGTLPAPDPATPGGLSGAVSLGISCARCHGDGAAHAVSREPADILNPAKLDARAQDHLCTQCHLASPLTFEMPGRSLASYQPGDDLAEWIGVLRAGERVDAAEPPLHDRRSRLERSRCFTGSQKPPSCSSCHDPHPTPAKLGDVRPADLGCVACHQPDACREPAERRSDGACHTCHMARAPDGGDPHRRVTDHWIRSTPARPPEPAVVDLVQLARSGVPLVNELDPEGRSPASDLLLARAYLSGLEAVKVTRDKVPDGWADFALGAVERHLLRRPDDLDALAIRGRVLTLQGRTKEAVPLLTRVHAARPASTEATTLLAWAHLGNSNATAAVNLLEQASRADPYDESVLISLASAYASHDAGQMALFQLDEMRKRLGPSMSRAHVGLEIASLTNNYDRAMMHVHDILIFDPRNPGMLFDAAEICRTAGSAATRIRDYYVEAIRFDPRFVEAIVRLAEFEIEQGRNDAARPLARRARALDPDDPSVIRINNMLR